MHFFVAQLHTCVHHVRNLRVTNLLIYYIQTPRFQRTPANIRINLVSLETKVLLNICVADSMGISLLLLSKATSQA